MKRYSKERSFIKEKKFEHVCKSCQKTFKTGDVKGKWCDECKQPRLCKCGCNKMVNSPGREYYYGCSKRGKTYSEIYKGETSKCGFKKGKLNPMNNSESVKKMLSRVSKRDIFYEGYAFRSSYELATYKILKQNNPCEQIKYEPIVKVNDKIYIPDFCIYNSNGDPKVILEVSGYGSFNEKGRKRNNDKIVALANHYPLTEIVFVISRIFIKHYNFTMFNNVKVYEYEQYKNNNIINLN